MTKLKNNRNLMKQYLSMLYDFLQSDQTTEDSERFLDIEIFSTANAVEMAETDEVCGLIDNDIADICAWISTGQDCTKERKELKKLYNQLVELTGIGIKVQ